MLPGVPEKLHQAERPEPVGVVAHAGGVAAVEDEKMRQLIADARQVGVDLLHGEERALGPLAAGVSHHPGPPAQQGDGSPAGSLQPGQAHHRHQIPDVKRVGGRVEADVGGDRPPGQPFLEARCGGVDEPAGVECGIEIFHGRESYGGETGAAR